MKKFFRKVLNSIICVEVQDRVYNYDSDTIEALFRTFKTNPIEDDGTKFNYYIFSDDSEEMVFNDNTYGTKCNFENSCWKFRLIKDLEIFYGRVLNFIVVHGSCVRYLNKNILLLGTRWSGKTTLTHYISIEMDGVYLADDSVYISGSSIVGFSMPLPIRNPDVCSKKSFFLSKTRDSDGVERMLFLPPNYLGNLSGVDIILFPKYEENGENSIRRINEIDAFKSIISNIQSHDKISNLFDTCRKLAQSCLCFELRYTSSENACALIGKGICHEAHIQ